MIIKERFTLDDGLQEAVKTVFVRLYQDGLIYRGERIINWDVEAKTALSNIEVEYKEIEGAFYHFIYPLVDEDGGLEIATTRPETMFGDVALMVHPNDTRYQKYIGKMVYIPGTNRKIPVISDEYVDMDFGTGVVKVTPAHDPNDFEVGNRHHLERIICMNEDGTMNEYAGPYQGMERFSCRKALVKDLTEKGLCPKIEKMIHSVGHSERTGVIVEPRLSKQWFVKMEPLARDVLEMQTSSERIEFIPPRFSKTLEGWLDLNNIQDWCISRQLWWGHRIPAYYCDDCGEMVVSKTEVDTCPKCGGKMHQDEDTLDTWFSSALWPFSTLGWPNETEDLKFFYPTSTLVTGYDIIFFWVARMIFSAIEQTGKTPFETVFIHGIVRDSQGRKMSKSLGNGIDPLVVIDEFGADALRFMLATGNSPGNDMRYSDDKVRASRNFANKLWNASRFILMNLSDDVTDESLPKTLTVEDKWVLSQYNELVRQVTDNLDKFELGIAVSKLYDFIWDVFCDWYIELCKARLQAGGDESLNAQKVLVYVMTNTLKLLHPFMPFITEEIWQALPHTGESIMISKFPEYCENLNFSEEEREFGRVVDAIKAIRNARAEMNVPPSRKAKVYVETQYPEAFKAGEKFFFRLAGASEIEIAPEVKLEGAVSAVTDSARLFIPLADLIDRNKELARLNKELAACQKDIDIISGKLNNERFMAKAPEKIVEQEKEKLVRAKERMDNINESLKALQ